jgi:hypothetical protein
VDQEILMAIADRPGLLIDERLDESGDPIRTYLAADGEGALTLVEGSEARALPARAVAVVMRRYGRVLEDGIAPDGDRLAIGELGTLARLRFRAAVDADGRDYLVWSEPGRPALACLARSAAAALRHLGGLRSTHSSH